MRRQSSVSFIGIDTITPLNEPLCGKYTKTFAYHTVKDRLPIILTKIVDQLARDKEEIVKKYAHGAEEDIKSVIGQISKLKNEVQTNKPLIELTSSARDVDQWNKYLLAQDDTPCWYQSTWLYVETYMYRRLFEMFENSSTLQQYDYFQKQKETAFNNSLSSLKCLSAKVTNAISNTDNNIKRNCIEMLKLSLWSNRCDLSLSWGEQSTDENNVLCDVSLLDPYLIVDETESVWEILKNSSGAVIDIVQDNAGYELFADLCLADFLISVLNVKEIRFHIKQMPWYVSDVTKNDFHWVIEQTGNNGMNKLSDRWNNYLQNGKWSVHSEDYWTMPFDYNDMEKRDNNLYQKLSQSSLIVFKGDLNYRKLLGDINWLSTDIFSKCLRSFRPSNVLALRTVKADLICGLSEGQADSLFDKDVNWMITGDYGVVQFSKSP